MTLPRTPSFRLDGRRALVTGAGRGIGLAAAAALAEAGADVTLVARTGAEVEAFRASVLAKIKLGRLGTVEDLMGAVLFLASDASALMTGTSLVVDGGWTAE